MGTTKIKAFLFIIFANNLQNVLYLRGMISVDGHGDFSAVREDYQSYFIQCSTEVKWILEN